MLTSTLRTLTRFTPSMAGPWLAVLAITVTLAAPTPAEAADNPALRLRIVGGLAGLSQFNHYEQPFWTDTVSVRTAGRVKAEIVPFDQAGIRGEEMLRLMQLGVVPFGTALLSMSATHFPELSAPDLAGLNPDIASVRRSVNAFRPYLEKQLRERYGLELLAVYAYPAQVLYCKKPFKELQDLAGRRIRTSSPSQSDLIEALGGTPVRTSFGEIMPNMTSGNLDCAITGTMPGNTIGLHEVTTHLQPVSLNWGLSIFAANAGVWNTLPPSVRAVLKEDLPKLEAAIWTEAEKETSQGISCNTGKSDCKSDRKGTMTLVPRSPGSEKQLREIVAGTVLTRWLQRCGPQCATVWNQTVGPSAGLPAAVR